MDYNLMVTRWGEALTRKHLVISQVKEENNLCKEIELHASKSKFFWE